MDNQTAKSIDRSLKSIASSLQKIEKNTRPTVTVAENAQSGNDIGEESIYQPGKKPRRNPFDISF